MLTHIHTHTHTQTHTQTHTCTQTRIHTGEYSIVVVDKLNSNKLLGVKTLLKSNLTPFISFLILAHSYFLTNLLKPFIKDHHCKRYRMMSFWRFHNPAHCFPL